MSEGQQALLHSVSAAAARLGEVSGSTIWRLIRDGALQAVKIRGRTLIPESELQRLAREGTDAVMDSTEPPAPLPTAQADPPRQRTSRRSNRPKRPK